MKTYSGKYKVKNPSKYEGDSSNVVYRSMWEAHCFKWADTNPKILKWSSEEVVIPYRWDIDKKLHRYFMDMKLVTQDKTILVEIKPAIQTKPPAKPANRRTKRYINESMTYVKNRNKWDAANEYAADRGWEFQIWTEDTLNSLGIMTKSKPLPKMPKMKPMKRKK